MNLENKIEQVKLFEQDKLNDHTLDMEARLISFAEGLDFEVHFSKFVDNRILSYSSISKENGRKLIHINEVDKPTTKDFHIAYHLSNYLVNENSINETLLIEEKATYDPMVLNFAINILDRKKTLSPMWIQKIEEKDNLIEQMKSERRR